MSKRIRSTVSIITILLLLITSVFPVNATAAESRASYYLTSYNAYPSAAGNGKIRIYFDVTGVGSVDSLGALKIQIYECTKNSSDINDWTRVKSFTNDDTPSMLGYNKYYHSSYVDYQGVAGRYYKAYVCIWAGKDGGGDTRYMWTSVKQAT